MPESYKPVTRKRNITGWRQVERRPMTMVLCGSCIEGPDGEDGHAELAFHPAQHIYKCSQCDGRWIRHYASMSEKYEWTRYKDEIRSLRWK
jgi:hypothetical protein